jgi:hypothetical protein
VKGGSEFFVTWFCLESPDVSEGLLGGRDQTGAPLFQTSFVFVLFVKSFVVAGIVAPGRRRRAGRRQNSPGISLISNVFVFKMN